MKTKLVFIGALCCFLLTSPLYAQVTKKTKKTEIKQKKMKVIKPTKIKKIPKKAKRGGHIDPRTGEWIPVDSPNESNTETRITSPRKAHRSISFIEIPVVIEGTTKRNSQVKVTILTTYKKYGQIVAKRKKMRLSSDSDGRWGAIKLYSIKVDEADSKATHKITAVRIEDDEEKGDTASVTVYSNPEEITSVKITSPKKNLYPVDEGYEDGKVTSPITFRGRAIKGHTVEIRVQTSQRTAGNYNDSGYSGSRVIKDWTPVTVNSKGHWSKRIDTGKRKGTSRGESYLTILVRDKAKKSEIKTLWLRR